MTSLPHKLLFFKREEIDACFVFTFSKKFRDMDPRDFLEKILFRHFDLEYLTVGYNFYFGKNRSGSTDLIAEYAEKRGIGFRVAKPVMSAGETISSSRIRALIRKGEMKKANVMLGRPYSVLATVVKGAGRGTRLGFPTANLDVHSEVLPPSGVYAVEVRSCKNTLSSFHKVSQVRPDCCFSSHRGLLNLGVTPTFGTRISFHAEVHIPGISRDFRGKLLEVTFGKKIRDEIKFDSERELCVQIARDIQKTGLGAAQV